MAPKSHHHAEASEPNHGYSLSERTSETDDQRIEEVTPLPPPEHLIRFFPIAGTPVEKLVGDTRRSVRRILDGKVAWRVQLNVRNLLNNADLIRQRSDPDEMFVSSAAKEPRNFILTNSFDF